MIYNLWRKLTEDKEDILASREKSLASLGNSSSPLFTFNKLGLLHIHRKLCIVFMHCVLKLTVTACIGRSKVLYFVLFTVYGNVH
jgi:hypothetical protein